MTGFDSYRNREPGWFLASLRLEWWKNYSFSNQLLDCGFDESDMFHGPSVWRGLLTATEPFDAARARREIAETWARIEREMVDADTHERAGGW